MAATKKMDPVIHFEMPAKDSKRVRAFYEQAFGWQTNPLPPGAGNFVMAFTSETDPTTRLPKKAGAINGGFYQQTNPDEHIKLTILVDDLKSSIQAVKKSGGTVIGEPYELPGVGLFVSFYDTEGNLVTMYQDFTLKTL